MNDKPPEKVTLDDLDNAPAALAPDERTPDQEKIQELYDRLSTVGDEKVKLQEEHGKLLDQIHRLQNDNNTSKILDELIKPYASKAFVFMCSYCGFAAVVLGLDAFSVRGFEIEPGVLEILVGSTAVTVIGLVGMVLTGIFVGARRK